MISIYRIIFYLFFQISLLSFFIGISYMPLSIIFGSLSGKLTFLNPSLSIIFSTSFIGKCFCIYKLFVSKFKFASFLYKLPSIASIIFFSLLKKYYFAYFIYIIYMIFLTITFVIFFQQTFIYSIFWLACIVYVLYLLFYRKKIYMLENSFLTTWLNQATGTIVYGYLNGFLTSKIYISILPIVFCERLLCIGIHCITYIIISTMYAFYQYIAYKKSFSLSVILYE